MSQAFVFANDQPPTRQLQTRINLNYRPLSRLSMDFKVIFKGQEHIRVTSISYV